MVSFGAMSGTGAGTLTWYLSADGGDNWEEVTPGTIHTFTHTGTDLRLKVVCSGGTYDLAVEDSNGYTNPIKVKYWTS